MTNLTSRRGILTAAASFLLAPILGRRGDRASAGELPATPTAALDNVAESDECPDALAVTSYTYDEHGRLLSATTAADSRAPLLDRLIGP